MSLEIGFLTMFNILLTTTFFEKNVLIGIYSQAHNEIIDTLDFPREEVRVRSHFHGGD
ncbi:hypothetical protein [Candidatus Parabeggiatoa sp. HSG14]|uniref:hypothetical protein n=1 Tax=Candidatus Parabeggiatoa sp. HSG14 TaxID=3055593 RepID=UPI0025A88610|nr:hypothetical protein [Thiotrichales bacterium HSG14]